MVKTALVAALFLFACQKTQPVAPPRPAQLAVRPAAEGRADLVAEISLPHPQTTLATVGVMAKKLGLPFSEQDVQRMGWSWTKLPESVLAKLDLGKPAGAVFLAGQKVTTAVGAVALKDPSDAGLEALAASIGRVAERTEGALRVEAADGGAGETIWMLARDGAVCLTDSKDALVAGAALALAARRTSAHDVRVALLPEGIARAAGTTVKDWFAKARAEMAAQQPPGMDKRTTQLAQTMLGYFMEAIESTTEARYTIALGADKGLTQGFEVVPRAGSPLAKLIAPRKAYVADPALLAGEPPVGFWSMGDMVFGREMFRLFRTTMIDTLVPEAERARVIASSDAIFDALAGPWSARFSFLAGPKLDVKYDLAYAVKPGVDGKAILTAMEDLLKAPWLARLLEASGSGLKMKLAAKREGDALVTKVTLDGKSMPPAARAQLATMPFFDGKPIEARTVVAGERLLMAIGPDGKARLAEMATAKGAPTGDLAAAFADTKGEDGLYYMDLAAMLKPAMAMAGKSPTGPGAMLGMAGAMLADAHLATWGSYRGGESLAITWRIPMATFDSVGAIVRGMMGGAPPN